MSAAGSIPDDLDRFVSTLAKHKVDFVVCGGFACMFYGVPRVTADIDIAVRLDDVNLRHLVAAAHELGLRPRVPEPLEALCDPEKRREWVEEKQARVFTLVDPNGFLHMDVFLTYPIPYDELSADARVAGVAGHTIHVSSKEHLIRAKQAVQPPREVDLRDIKDLQELIEHERKAR